ncbi:MAG: hypothetical protein KDC99_06630 [Cyclobacteriaceae bacterium]|nr:hypothetical protein [Cyclobacteriaceae bacterium]
MKYNIKRDWRSLAVLLIISANHFMQRPLRDTLAVAVGAENLNWLMAGTLTGTVLLSFIIIGIERRVDIRKLVPYLLIVVGIGQLMLYYRLNDINFINALLYFSFNGATSLTILTLTWRRITTAQGFTDDKRLNAYTATNLGAIAGPLLTLIITQLFGELTLLPFSTTLLILCAVYLISLDRRCEEVARFSSSLPRLPVKRLIAFMVLYTFVATGFYYFTLKTVGTHLPQGDRNKLFTFLDLITNCSVLVLPHLLRRWSRQPIAFLIVPCISLLLLSSLGIRFTIVTAVVALVVFKVSNLSVQRPAREWLYLQSRFSTPYSTQNFLDAVIYRLGDVTAAWMITLMLNNDAGFTQVLSVFVMAASLWIITGYSISKNINLTN